MTFHFTTLKGYCRLINCPNFNIVVSQEIVRHEEMKRDGEQLVSGVVRIHTLVV